MIKTIVCALAALALASPAAAQWKPTQPVEIVVPAAAGGANDLTGRLVQRVVQEARLVEPTVSVVNKPGGGHTIGLNYLNQRPADGHTIMVETIDLLVNRVTGKINISHNDLAPIAVLFADYIALSVRADAALKSLLDLNSRAKQAPASFAVALSSSLGNANHIAAGLYMRSIGADARKMRIVVFNSGSETMTSLLGGHVELVAGPAVLAARHAQTGKVRVLAVSAPQRLGGALAETPTLREQGVDVVTANWRSLIGPRGLGAEQVAFWDAAMAKVVQTDEWKKDLERNLSRNTYMGAAETRKYMDAQYLELRGILTDLGLAK